MASLRRRPRKPLVTIIGTTGTGKSDLAVDLALAYNGEIINADAMQMYKGLPVITNQISAEEQRGIPHHLISHIDALEPTWTNGLFMRQAQRLIKEIRSRGKLPIVVGGTHYYVHTLLFEGNLIESNETEPEEVLFRSQEETRSHFPILNQPTHVILDRLREVDPLMAERWHPDDRRKIKRSLEICLTTGKRASDIYAEQQKAKLASTDTREPWETLVFWTYSETDALRERLSKRVDKMVQNGLMDEVRVLHRRLRECTERGEVIDRTRGIWQSIGFKQMEAFLNGELDAESPEVIEKKKEVGLEEINIATRQYARYQLRWIHHKTLKLFKEHNAMDWLYLLDSTEADKFSDNVLLPASDLCQRYLAGEERPRPAEISDTARTLFATFENERSTQITFKVRKCEDCDKSLVTEVEWFKHIHSKKHKKTVRMKKRLALVPVETEPQLSEEANSIATEVHADPPQEECTGAGGFGNVTHEFKNGNELKAS
ncbi:IPP transferase-domain-containing protein [Xylaria sp. FL1042]|nr:IPP transferase-domain-containing protein [Xylaria sp. FL1042]